MLLPLKLLATPSAHTTVSAPHAGKNWQSSEAAHEARVAVELGLRPGKGEWGVRAWLQFCSVASVAFVAGSNLHCCVLWCERVRQSQAGVAQTPPCVLVCVWFCDMCCAVLCPCCVDPCPITHTFLMFHNLSHTASLQHTHKHRHEGA